jgi:hypothetical protein
MKSTAGQCVLAAPSQAFGPTYAEGVIEKKPAGLICPGDSEKP